jgi:hypothetical protein
MWQLGNLSNICFSSSQKLSFVSSVLSTYNWKSNEAWFNFCLKWFMHRLTTCTSLAWTFPVSVSCHEVPAGWLRTEEIPQISSLKHWSLKMCSLRKTFVLNDPVIDTEFQCTCELETCFWWSVVDSALWSWLGSVGSRLSACVLETPS